MSVLISGSMAFDTIMGKARRVSEGPVDLRWRDERPAAGGRAGTTTCKMFEELL